MSEDSILNRVEVEQQLQKLKSPLRRMVLTLMYMIECPDDWEGKWPPTYAEVGRYVGEKFRGKAFSEATMRYQEMCALRELNPMLAPPRHQRRAAGRDPEGEPSEE